MERPPALVVETTEYPFGRENRIWRLGFVEQVAHPLSGFSSGVKPWKTGAVNGMAMSSWPRAWLLRVAEDAANQAVRVVAHSGIGLRIDARHLAYGFPVRVDVFADDIQRI